MNANTIEALRTQLENVEMSPDELRHILEDTLNKIKPNKNITLTTKILSARFVTVIQSMSNDTTLLEFFNATHLSPLYAFDEFLNDFVEQPHNLILVEKLALDIVNKMKNKIDRDKVSKHFEAVALAGFLRGMWTAQTYKKLFHTNINTSDDIIPKLMHINLEVAEAVEAFNSGDYDKTLNELVDVLLVTLGVLFNYKMDNTAPRILELIKKTNDWNLYERITYK